MKRLVLLIVFAGTGILLAGRTATTTQTAAHVAPRAPHTRVVSTPVAPKTIVVPNDLVGKTMAAAKTELSSAGFTNIVVAGGNVTDTDKVTSAPEAGQSLSPSSRVRLIATPSGQQADPDSVSACWADETKCYMDGQQCATGSCVNAARGLSPSDVQRQTREWLAAHPGYCAAGVTGAVAPCSGGGDGSGLTDSDPGFRDANGETKAEYCARTGQPLATCDAG